MPCGRLRNVTRMAIAPRGEVELHGASNCLVHTDNQLITLLGAQNLIVAATRDAVLVADKSKSEDVKMLVHQLEQKQRREVTEHRVVTRPWGHYDSVDRGERFQVKRLVVKP